LSAQQSLIRHLVRNPVRSPIGFETWLVEAFVAMGSERDDAERTASSRKRRLWTEFAKADDELAKRGCGRIFERVDDRSLIFRTPGLPSDVKGSTKRFLYEDRHVVIRWLDNLGDRKFEFLGAALTWFLGARRFKVTTGGNDGGVDFYALLPSWGNTSVIHSPHKYIRIVGQSKYYAGPVGVDAAKLLIKTVEDIRSYTVEMAPRIPTWFVECRGPVVGMIVAPNGFQSGAITKSNFNGIMLADNIDVAEAIIHSRAYRLKRSLKITPHEVLEAALTAVGWR
jgi:hypothetical protein